MAAKDDEVGRICRKELEGPPLIGAEKALISRWHQVQLGRGEGALSWTSLVHFTDITGEKLRPGEAEALLQIDHTYRAEVLRPAKKG